MSGTSHIVLIDGVDILFFIIIFLFSVVKCEYDFHQKYNNNNRNVWQTEVSQYNCLNVCLG